MAAVLYVGFLFLLGVVGMTVQAFLYAYCRVRWPDKPFYKLFQ